MSLASVLNFTIPAVLIAYAIYLLARMARTRRRCGGGCFGCPYAGQCGDAAKKERKRDEP